MSMHTIRDWRGNKAKLGSYTDGELVELLRQSDEAREQIARFAHEVAAELGHRAADVDASGVPLHHVG